MSKQTESDFCPLNVDPILIRNLSKFSEDRFVPPRRTRISSFYPSSEDEETSNLYTSTVKKDLCPFDLSACRSRLSNIHKSFPLTTPSFKPKQSLIQKFALPTIPYKALDAPGINDDFYSNVFSVSNRDSLAISLNNTLYVLNPSNDTPVRLYEAFNCEAISSLSWDEEGKNLAVGNILGQVSLWDVEKGVETACMDLHTGKVGAVSFSRLIASGGFDGEVIISDSRGPTERVNKVKWHGAEVCSLSWSPGEQFIASGGNDNRVLAWVPGSAAPLLSGMHKAAVRALGWSPRQHGVLGSGGGSIDKVLKIWSVQQSDPIFERDTGSQICCLAFSKLTNDVITGHGAPQNEISFWRTNGLKKVGSIFGHSARVLNLGLIEKGTSLVSVSADETMRFWKAYAGEASDRAPSLSPPPKSAEFQPLSMR